MFHFCELYFSGFERARNDKRSSVYTTKQKLYFNFDFISFSHILHFGEDRKYSDDVKLPNLVSFDPELKINIAVLCPLITTMF